jgi:hypothetical protein
MPPPPFRRVIVAAHRLPAMRTLLLRPERWRLRHPDEHFAFRRHIIHPVNPPGFPQRQELLKHFLRYHPTISSHFPPALNPFTHYKRRGTKIFDAQAIH